MRCQLLREQDIRLFKVFQEATAWKPGGEVVLRSGENTGRVFFARGKIAWVVVSTISRTFTEYLADQSSISLEEAREVFDECQRTGKNFGETIVKWGLLDEMTLRLLLLQHISGCMLEIFSWSSVESMFMPEERAYEGSLTFDFVEILQTALILDTEKRLPFSDMKVYEIMAEIGRHMSQEKELQEGGEAESGSKGEPADQAQEVPEDWAGAKTDAPGTKRRGLLVVLLILLAMALGGLGYTYRHRLAALLGLATAPESSSKGLETVAAGPSPGEEAGASLDAGVVSGADSGPAGEEHVTSSPGDTDAVAGDGQGQPATDDQVPAPELAPVEPEGFVLGWPGEGTGSIRVTSRPRRAPIYIDGVFTGHVTPCTLRKVPAGREHLVMLEKRRRRPAHRTVRVWRGKRATVKFSLKRSRRRLPGDTQVHIISDPPGAAIWLDGKETGEITPADIPLRNSSATKLELRLPGSKPWKRTVRPTTKQTITIYARLNPA